MNLHLFQLVGIILILWALRVTCKFLFEILALGRAGLS